MNGLRTELNSEADIYSGTVGLKKERTARHLRVYLQRMALEVFIFDTILSVPVLHHGDLE